MNDAKFRERYRVPRGVVDLLEERLGPTLQHSTRRNNALTAREQILTFLHFVGTNSFYHVVRDCHGLSTNTVYRITHDVISALFELKNEFITFPANPHAAAGKFKDVAGIPFVAGAVDGTHVRVFPPKEHEAAFVNRHHEHSLNAVMVCGPDTFFYYANSSSPGRFHDSRVSVQKN